VIFFEHKRAYQHKGEVPAEQYTVPFGKAAIRREGTDVTIVSYSMMALRSMEAAEELEKEGISCEVIDLRSLVPLDYDTVMESVRKTNRVVVAQESHLRGSLASDIVSEIIDRGFDYLDAPPIRVGSLNVPMPYNIGLENMVVPNKETIKQAVHKALGNK
jgi:pyruvate dehydrogenase E1 component beta subunit